MSRQQVYGGCVPLLGPATRGFDACGCAKGLGLVGLTKFLCLQASQMGLAQKPSQRLCVT